VRKKKTVRVVAILPFDGLLLALTVQFWPFKLQNKVGVFLSTAKGMTPDATPNSRAEIAQLVCLQIKDEVQPRKSTTKYVKDLRTGL
jgi:hypothetical protein